MTASLASRPAHPPLGKQSLCGVWEIGGRPEEWSTRESRRVNKQKEERGQTTTGDKSREEVQDDVRELGKVSKDETGGRRAPV